MIQFITSPDWFLGKDLLIDMLSVIVLFLIGFFSLRSYRINPTKKTFVQLAASFFIISVSFLFKVLTNFTLYLNVLQTHQIGQYSFTYQFLQPTDILFTIGSLIYRILTLIGLYLLYSIYNPQPRSSKWLSIFLIVIAMYFSQESYYIFHLTSLFLLVLITSRYYTNLKETKSHSARLLAISFFVITLSHLGFCFIMLNPLLYVIAELIQLIGYIILLITFIRVLRDGKKKK
jgi:hypothetical protein